MLGQMTTPPPSYHHNLHPGQGPWGWGPMQVDGIGGWGEAETVLHLPDLCLLAAGRASTNDLQMKQGGRRTIGCLCDWWMTSRTISAISHVVLMFFFSVSIAMFLLLQRCWVLCKIKVYRFPVWPNQDLISQNSEGVKGVTVEWG